MGLKKRISQGNGVVLNYHRVVSVHTITNNQTIVEVAGYTSQAKRREEKEAAELVAQGQPAECDVYIATTYFNAEYDPGMTVINAYNYLKGLPEFEGATDVLELDAEEPSPEPTPEPEPEPEQEQETEPTQEESEGGE